jgi:hypothetical protein
VLVGHGLHHDLGLLLKRGRNIYSHPNRQLRDLEVLCAAGGVTPGLGSDFGIFLHSVADPYSSVLRIRDVYPDPVSEFFQS